MRIQGQIVLEGVAKSSHPRNRYPSVLPFQSIVHTPACDSDPSTATVRSLGPLADQDEHLKGRTKTSAREINNARLWEAVERVAPRSPQHVKEHKPGH